MPTHHQGPDHPLDTTEPHISQCGSCQLRRVLPPAAVPDNVDSTQLPDIAVPASLLQSLNTFAFDAPQAGQIWRLEFDGIATPVLVLETSDTADELRVAAIGEDAEFADAATVVIAEDDSPYGFAVGIWLTLEHRVPSFTADRLLGDLADPVWKRVVRVREALRSGGALEGDGAKMHSTLDPRVDYRAAIEEPLVALANAAWSLLEDADTQSGEESDLFGLLRDHGVGRQDLLEAGFSTDEVAALRVNALILTDREASALATVAGVAVEEIHARAPSRPPELVLELHLPERRRQLARSGPAHGNPPAVERRVAVRQLVKANKRRAGRDRQSTNWQDALDQWFATR